MRRLMFWLGVLGVFVIGGYVATAGNGGLRWRSPPQYRTAAVTRGHVDFVVNSTGTVKPVRSVSVGAFASGPIAEILVDFNSAVQEGDLMARIDPRLQRADLERTQAALATQKAELARVEALLQQAVNNEERAKKLRAVNKEYLSDNELDQYHFARKSFEAQKQLAEANIAQAQAALKNSQANLAYTEIRSPVAGIVIERKVDPGQTVAASFQTPELFIVAPEMDKHMHVFASVDEADIGLIRAAQERGQGVKFTVDAYPEQLFSGHIAQIRKNSTTTQNVVTYPVVIEAPNPELRLLPGMTASITFQIDSKDDVLRVPTAALRYYPPSAQIHPDDRHYLEGVQTREADAEVKLSAGEKATLARNRSRRLVWVQQGEWLRAIPVVLGLTEGRQAELVEGKLVEHQALIIGVEAAFNGASGGR